jgi:hypothetical protein
MSINLSALMKQRYDTAANWTAQNPTLLAGEIGIESDTKKWKVGTGATAWTSLVYAIGGTYPIVNADIAAAAAIAYSKLATLTSGNIVLGSAANVATSTAVTGDVTISNTGVTAIAAGVIVNADINASAAIVDTKLATIATAGKVSNSATTAASANTASAIVARDASGNFTAGTITAALTGAASSNVLKAGDTMTGVLAVTAGTAALPGIAVSGDPNTGITSPGADQLAISTGGTERMRITSDAYVRLASGTGGIQFNGDTAAANALDDYEEGTWTPTAPIFTGDASALFQVANYIKIGRKVTVFWTLISGGSSGSVQIPTSITGLPYAMGSGASFTTGNGTIAWVGGNQPAGGTLPLRGDGDSTTTILTPGTTTTTTGAGYEFTLVFNYVSAS